MAKQKTISIWDNNWKYQHIYDTLWSELVPDSGESHNYIGEMIRGMGRLTHEYCNNGNCNAMDDNFGENVVSEMYESFLKLYDDRVDGVEHLTEEVRELITGSQNYNYSYSQKEHNIYMDLFNAVMVHIINEMNIIPSEYFEKQKTAQIKDKRSTAVFYENRCEEFQFQYKLMVKVGDVELAEEVKARMISDRKTANEYKAKVRKLRQERNDILEKDTMCSKKESSDVRF